jgi:hypothetical protein
MQDRSQAVLLSHLETGFIPVDEIASEDYAIMIWCLGRTVSSFLGSQILFVEAHAREAEWSMTTFLSKERKRQVNCSQEEMTKEEGILILRHACLPLDSSS